MMRTETSQSRLVLLLVLALGPWTLPALCPFKCVCNEDKLTVWCAGAGLDIVPITLNPALQELFLSNNHIKSILAAFTVYRKLEYLDMSHNQLVSLGQENFAAQIDLQVLHLSRNTVSTLHNGSFAGLDKLRILNLRENFLKEIPSGVFGPLRSLEQLDLSQNRLMKVTDHAFLGLASLRSLMMRDNMLKHIPIKSFQDIAQLKGLDLGLNAVKVVSAHAFHSLTELEELNLDGCEVHTVRRSAFKNLLQLKSLHLQNNDLTEVPTVALQILANLHFLRIGQNGFQALKPLAFRGLYSLRTLVINGAPLLSSVQRGTFSDNSQLEFLTLNYNKELSSLDYGVFEGLDNLNEVHLRGNDLTSIPQDLLEWSRLEVFDVRDNPLECNCSILWFRDFLRSSNFSSNADGPGDFKQVVCGSPELLKDVLLVDTTDNDLGCHRLFYLQIWVLSALAAALVVISVIAVGLWYRVKVITYLKKKYQADEKVQPVLRSPEGSREEKIVPLVMRNSPKLRSVTEL